MQLDFGFPVVEDYEQNSNVKYTVDISHLHYFYILVNSCGVLEKVSLRYMQKLTTLLPFWNVTMSRLQMKS